MKLNKWICVIVGAASLWLAAGGWAQTTISNLVVAQRPGTKLVDITYDVSSIAYVTLIVSNAGVMVSAVNLTGDVGLVGPGPGKSIVWDMAADWNRNLAVLSFALTAQLPAYLVVNISGGATATNYPVSYLDAVPSGGWTDGYKTTKLVLRRISAGTFTMGSPSGELGRIDSNESQHIVTLAKDYYIGVFEVTQKQWERVMGDWPSYFTNATYREFRPVEQVS